MVELIGGSGYVGSTVLNLNTKLELDTITTPSRDELDILDASAVLRYIEQSPASVVVNCAAYTDVKRAEVEPETARKLNATGAHNLAVACARFDKFLIHFSTNAVFPIDTETEALHAEDDDANPDPSLLKFYGYSKLLGERAVLDSGARAAILRISYPFGNPEFPDKDYVVKLLKMGRAGYGLLTDQFLTATFIPSIVPVIETLATRQLPGVYHWVCRGMFTPHEMATRINDTLILGLTVKETTLQALREVNIGAQYARSSGLSTEHTEKTLGITPPTWQEALREYLKSPELVNAISNLEV